MFQQKNKHDFNHVLYGIKKTNLLNKDTYIIGHRKILLDNNVF